MRYYEIIESKNNPEVWDVVIFNRIIIRGVGNADVANEVAEKLNEAYRDGIDEGKNIVKKKLDELLFSE